MVTMTSGEACELSFDDIIPEGMMKCRCEENSCQAWFLAPKSSRARFCCACRAARRHRRKERVISRTPLHERAIQSRAELDRYFSNTELECLICGERKAGLYQHVLRAHGIRAHDYKVMMNIPVSYGLTGSVTFEKLQVCAASTKKKMEASGYDNLVAAREALKAARKSRGERLQWPSYFTAEHAAKMIDSPRHPRHAEGKEIVVCHRCGTPFGMHAAVALSFQCRAVCPDCK